MSSGVLELRQFIHTVGDKTFMSACRHLPGVS